MSKLYANLKAVLLTPFHLLGTRSATCVPMMWCLPLALRQCSTGGCASISTRRNLVMVSHTLQKLCILCCGKFWDMRAHNSTYPNFLNKCDPDFSYFTRTLDKHQRECVNEMPVHISPNIKGIYTAVERATLAWQGEVRQLSWLVKGHTAQILHNVVPNMS